MKAGRELDINALVATEIMGWKLDDMEAGGWQRWSDGDNGWVWTGYRTPDAPTFFDEELWKEMPEMWNLLGTIVWNPIEDIAAAWEVVEKMIAEFPAPEYQFGVTWVSLKDGWSAGMGHFQHGGSYSDEWYSVFGETAAHAVCLAALKAKGIDV